MRVLYIDHHAGSPTLGMDVRPHQMAQEWAKSGVRTTVLAGSYSHRRTTNPVVERTGEVQVVDGVPFRFIRTRAYRGGRQSAVSMMEFVGKGLRDATRIAHATLPDAVISSSNYPFDTYLAQKIAKLTGARLVHESDGFHGLRPLGPRGSFAAMMAAAERSALSSSDVIVSTVPDAEDHVRSLGISTPVVTVPHGVQVDPGPGPGDAEVLALVTKLQAQGRDVIGCVGGPSMSFPVEALVRAMEVLREQPISAVIIAGGDHRSALESLASTLGLDNVHVVAPVARAAVHHTLAAMDGLYLGVDESAVERVLDYMLTGVPIIDTTGGASTPLRQADCAVPARGNDPVDIARAIREVIDLDATQRVRMRATQIAHVREHHAHDRVAATFLAVLKD